jgi:hypothetical protein
MNAALWLMAVQGLLGAFDTLYYHELRAKLPAMAPSAGIELRLHATRDFIYAILFLTLPLVRWQGAWAVVLIALLAAEVVVTLADFNVEDRVRVPLGGLYSGERATHAVMGIVYGAFLANLIPVVLGWFILPTHMYVAPAPVPMALSGWLMVAGVGVFLSGIRDLAAAYKIGFARWPW